MEQGRSDEKQMIDPLSAIVSHLKEMAQSLPGKVHPGRSGKTTIHWLGWQPPAHRPEALGEHVRLKFTLHENVVRCAVDIHIHALRAFGAIGPSAEADDHLDGLEDLVTSAHAIAQWMTPNEQILAKKY